MRVLITTDAFPPSCGGSGWSTYELAKGLRESGHEIEIVRPLVDRDAETAEFDGFAPRPFRQWTPNLPYVRNYFRNERLYARLATEISRLIREQKIDIVHAQHRLTGPPSITAANLEGVPAVCTVRDYWPVCYWSDLIVNPDADALCPSCTVSTMARCVRPRAGTLWPCALPMIPYMRGNLFRKRRVLSLSATVIAVSSAIATDLKQRAPELANTCVVTIPNPVDVEGIRRTVELHPAPLQGNYGLYVGKLEVNKGVLKLFAALSAARFDWPFIIVGDGAERARLEAEAQASGRDVRFVGWRPREEVLAWMRHATLLVFPSQGPEALSRVLLEAGALGVPLAAMDTGGTTDIVLHERTGLLSRTADGLGVDVARLRTDANLRVRLGRAIRQHVDEVFASRVIVRRVETLYERLLGERTTVSS